MKQPIKRSVKRLLLRNRGNGTDSRANDSRILTYHSVGDRSHEMNVTPQAFEEQMRWLAASCTPIRLGDAAKGKPGVAITFDDGFADNLSNALPLLQELGLPATVFMVAGYADKILFPELGEGAGRLLSWTEIKSVHRMGFEIGAHTVNHARLSKLTVFYQAEEIHRSKRMIEEHLGHPVEAFAYPYGSILDYSRATVQLVRDAGFVCAVSNRYGVNKAGCDRWNLRRIWIDATDNLDTFQAKVRGDLDALRYLDSWPGIRIRQLLNRVS